MNQFEFVIVFVSIVVAFAVSDVLAGWGEQIRLRREVRHYPLHTVWAVLLLFVMMQGWWSLWELSERAAWTFPQYVALVIPYLTLALMAYVVTPELSDNTDIKKHYFDDSRWFFSLGAFYLSSWAFFSYVVLGNPLNEPGSFYRAAGILLMLVLAFWSNERVHAIVAAFAYLLMAAWVAAVIF